MGADDGGIDARAEIVDVGDRHDPDATVAQGVERAERRNAWKRSPVPGRVQRRSIGGVNEELARRIQTQRDELVEDEW